MELRQLQYAIQIAEEMNFSRAAEKLHIAQPSLSQQLSKLEKELGVKLFHRSTNSVELTHEGELFMEKARSILDMVNQLKKEMDDISQLRAGKLIVGSLPITGSHILPLVLPEFRTRFPEIEVVLVEETTSNLEKLTANGGTDISLLTLPLEEQMLEYIPLIEEEIIPAVSPKHPLALKLQKNPQFKIHIRDLREEPFIILKKGQGFREITLDICRHAGFTPKIVFESSNIETVQSLVASGMGVAFVPMMLIRSKETPFAPVYLPVHDPRPTRTLVIAYRKGRYLSKASEAFIHTMLEIIKNQYRD